MNEEELLVAATVRRALESNIRNIEPRILHGLSQARQHALSHHRLKTGYVLVNRMGMLGLDSLLPHARTAMAIAALMLGMVGSYYWNMFEDADEYADIDSAILADDMPVDAYSDQGFHAWLDHSSQTSP